eukprot:jgi/Ulvmu1/6052/UM027_0030.1
MSPALRHTQRHRLLDDGLEAQVPTQQVSQAEVERFEVDESLSEIERCALYLQSSEPLQVAHAFQTLPKLIGAQGRAVLTPAVCKHLKAAASRAGPLHSIVLAESLQAIVEQHLLPKRIVIEQLWPVVLHQVQLKPQNQAEEVWAAWESVLLAAAPTLEATSEAGALSVVAIRESHPETGTSLSKRVRACSLLAAAATACRQNDEALTRISGHVRLLCQDLSQEMRASVCRAVVAPLTLALGPERSASQLLPDLLELLQDDHATVRHAALRTMVATLPEVRPAAHAACLPALRPLFSRQPPDAAADPAADLALAAAFASPTPLPMTLQPLEPRDAAMFLGCYCHLALRGPPPVRLDCARAFPALLLAMCPDGAPTTQRAPLLDAMLQLSADAEEEVRCSIAAQLPQLSMLAGLADARPHLLRPLTALTRDTSAAVSLHALHAVPLVVPRMAPLATAAARDVTASVAAAAAEHAGARWRHAAAVAAAVPPLAAALPPGAAGLLHEALLPLAFRLLEGGVRAVQASAAAALCAVLRALPKERQRTEVLIRIIRDFARSRSAPQRLVFPHIANAALATFSATFFSQHMLPAVLALCTDRVADVRAAVAPLLPATKRTIRLPDGVAALESLNTAASSLLTDSDRRVSAAARGMHAHLKAVPVRLASVGVLDMHGASARPEDIAYEQADRVREEAEQDFTVNQDDLDKALTAAAAVVVASERGGPGHRPVASRGGPPQSPPLPVVSGRGHAAGMRPGGQSPLVRTLPATSAAAVAVGGPRSAAGMASAALERRAGPLVVASGAPAVTAAAAPDWAAGGRGSAAGAVRAVRGGRTTAAGAAVLSGRQPEAKGAQQRAAGLALPSGVYGASAAGSRVRIGAAGARTRPRPAAGRATGSGTTRG